MIRVITLILFASASAVLGQGAHYTYPFKIECPDYRVQSGEQVTIRAKFESEHKYSSTYNWSVSMGTIVSGQGTPSITIENAKTESGTLTVSLDRAFNEAHFPGVQNQATCSFEIVPSPAARMVDEFRSAGSNCEEGFARLDAFFAELNNNPADQGLIIVYGDDRDHAAATRRELQLRNYFSFRKFPRDRVTIVRGIAKASGPTQFWIVPPGADIPEIERESNPADKPPTGPYLYAASQIDGVAGCSGHLYDIEDYANVLKADPASSGRIVIRESSRSKYDRKLKELITELTRFGIARRRIRSVYKYVRPNRMLEGDELWVLPGKKTAR